MGTNLVHPVLQALNLDVLDEQMFLITEVLDDVLIPFAPVDFEDEGFDGRVALDERSCPLRQPGTAAPYKAMESYQGQP